MKLLYYLLAALALGTGLLATACHSDSQAPAFNIVIGPLPPNDLAPGSDPVKLAEFAWAEFFALNWQASYHRPHQPGGQDTLRDNPDRSWNYGLADTTVLSVWETYAHRTELRPFRPYRDSLEQAPFDQPPHYSFGVRLQPAQPTDSLNLFDNLDENSEIGSCAVYHLNSAQDTLVTSRKMVLYQAKVNREEYDYIRRNHPTEARLAAARQRNIDSISSRGYYYNAAYTNHAYTTCNCPPGMVCLPCGGTVAQPAGQLGGQPDTLQGAIEVKSAWRRLAAGEDASRYLVRRVIFYDKEVVVQPNPGGIPTPDTVVHYRNARYALIGLHIIHKTTNYPDFVFATFEQVDVTNTTHPMAYLLLNQGGYATQSVPSTFARLHQRTRIDSLSTVAAHAALRKINPNSVFQYYRLVGVQGTPTGNPSTPNFYLANYVIESDQTLANFHGSGFGAPHNRWANTLRVTDSTALSAGGCQGCHGVAQTTFGNDFSFLLDTIGKPVRFPDLDTVQFAPAPAAMNSQALLSALRFNPRRRPRTPPARLGKLGRYIEATRHR